MAQIGKSNSMSVVGIKISKSKFGRLEITHVSRKPLREIDINAEGRRVQPSRHAKKPKTLGESADVGFAVHDENLAKEQAECNEQVNVALKNRRNVRWAPVIAQWAPVRTPTSLAPVIAQRTPIISPLVMDTDVFDSEESIEEAKSDSSGGCECEYDDDIYSHLLRREKKTLPKPKYMTKQIDINHSMRTILVDWLVEVGEEYDLHTETLYIAVNLIDRFLSKMSVTRAKLQLMGAAAMFVAAKFEEIYPPGVKDFIYITDDSYSMEELFRMEDLLLRILDFDVSSPTPTCFLRHFNKMATSDNVTSSLSQFLVEVALTKGELYVRFEPSLVCAAAVCLARHTLGHPPWPEKAAQLSGYKCGDIQPCMVAMWRLMVASAGDEQQAVRDKYSSAKHNQVSTLNPSPALPF